MQVEPYTIPRGMARGPLIRRGWTQLQRILNMSKLLLGVRQGSQGVVIGVMDIIKNVKEMTK